MAFPDAVIVFGASGFVGRNMVLGLAGKVGRVVAVSQRGASIEGATESLTFDALAGLSNLPSETVVIHLAAQRYDASRHSLAQSDLIVSNTRITNAIYQFCLERGIKEVRSASSVAVYPAALDVMDDEQPIDLNEPPHRSESLYAWSKRWGEIVAGLYAERYGVNTIAFRLSNPYGPHDSRDASQAHVLPAFVMRALEEGPTFILKGNPLTERDFIFVEDVVSVFERSLLMRGVNDEMNLCRGETTTLADLARSILRIAGCDKPLVVDDGGGQHGVAARRSTSSKVKRIFEMDRFTDLDIGLRPTITWYRGNAT